MFRSCGVAVSASTNTHGVLGISVSQSSSDKDTPLNLASNTINACHQQNEHRGRVSNDDMSQDNSSTYSLQLDVRALISRSMMMTVVHESKNTLRFVLLIQIPSCPTKARCRNLSFIREIECS